MVAFRKPRSAALESSLTAAFLVLPSGVFMVIFPVKLRLSTSLLPNPIYPATLFVPQSISSPLPENGVVVNSSVLSHDSTTWSNVNTLPLPSTSTGKVCLSLFHELSPSLRFALPRNASPFAHALGLTYCVPAVSLNPIPPAGSNVSGISTASPTITARTPAASVTPSPQSHDLDCSLYPASRFALSAALLVNSTAPLSVIAPTLSVCPLRSITDSASTTIEPVE